MKFKFAVSMTLIVALVLLDSGCTAARVVRTPAPRNPDELAREVIVGVTTIRGEEISFDDPGGTITGEAIEARVEGQPRKFPLSDLTHVWLMKRHLTSGAKAAIGAGIAAAAVVAVVAVRALSSKSAPAPTTTGQSSCPYVYSWDGSQYVLDGEPYGGAIARGLAREDWSELTHIRDAGGEYRVLMTNEAEETQNTDLAELWIADHPAGVRVVADDNGNLVGLSNIRPLLKAQDRTGRDITEWLIATDRRIWEPEPVPDPDGGLESEIILTFPKPTGTGEAWLVANSTTAMWGSLLMKQILSLPGRDADHWLDSLDTNFFRAASVYRWVDREQTFLLKVDVEEASGWKTRGSIFGGGPMAAENHAVPLDVRGASGDFLRVRLRPPRGFWALNSFEVSYHSAGRVPFTRVAAQSALTSDARDVRKELASADGVYYSMSEVGNSAILRYKTPPLRPGMERTVFLHSAGWYRMHLGATGASDVGAFNEILDTPGGVARFAASRYGAQRTASRSQDRGGGKP